MSPRPPIEEGTVERDGVHISYQVHGHGEPTIVALPAWMIVHSRIWKAQVAALADHHRIVTYDARGSGRSDRPTDPAAYDIQEHVADALAVLDATGTDRAVMVGNSFGGLLAYLLAAMAPDRVEAAVFVGATINLEGTAEAPLARALLCFDDAPAGDDGWQRYSRRSWERDFPGFVRWFTETALAEPHTTRPREEALEWGLDTTAEVLAATVAPRAGVPPEKSAAVLRSLAPSITCPTMVVQGSLDEICPPEWGREVAATLGAELVVLPDAAHCPQVRFPIEFNRLLRSFIDRRVTPTATSKPQPATPGPVCDPGFVPGGRTPRRPRVLYLSSPIGLGHARRDLAIASELRTLVPEVEIDWLAQDPVTRFLDDAGEHVHPASHRLASESAHLEREMGEHDLHVFQALRRMDEILVTNFSVFADVTEADRYDLVVGDESWEVDHFLHEHPAFKRSRFAWLSDFVGIVPMPAGGEREAFLATDWNREMIGHVERHPDVRDRSIFVGDPEDIVPHRFGPGLPSIAEWTIEHYDFSGYITGFDPDALGDRAALREALGYRSDEVVVIAAVGGSGVGLPLLRRIVDAHPIAAASIPGLRTVVVTGPRVDPALLPEVDGVETRGFVPDLHRHLAACDLAVVQGGLTTTMELTAAGRPFLYFPLANHFEQQVHVRHRLERHGAGRAMDYATATPEVLAEAMVQELRRPIAHRPVPSDGARRAAGLLHDLL